jgi:hypothetical protein
LQPRVSGASFTPDGKCLISSSIDGSALVWDLGEYAIRPVPARAWDDLGAEDGRTAFAAVCSLAGDPKRALRLLTGHLGAARVDAKQVRGWLDDLDSESFQKREQAERRLAALQEHVEADLLAALAGSSLETRTRLRRLLQRIDKGSPAQWRRSRALEVLEHIGSVEAVALLKKIAAGYTGSALTREAKESLARLQRRRGSAP